MSYCHKCGAQLTDESATFCSKCGTHVSAPAGPSDPVAQSFAPMPASQQSYQPSPKRGLGVGAILGIIAAVLLVLAVMAAIAIPTFLGQRQKAQDASARVLVRNAMTAIESGYVDTRTFDPATLTPVFLRDIEPSITWIAVGDERAATNPKAQAAAYEVEYSGTLTTYAVGTLSETGKTFGVIVDKGQYGSNTFYVGGVARQW